MKSEYVRGKSVSMLQCWSLGMWMVGALIVAAGCSGGGGNGATTDPSVMTMEPPDRATGVVVSAQVQAAFSEAMDPATITGSTFILRDAGNNAVSGTVSYDAGTDTATFAPDADLSSDATYTATLTTAITNAGGTALSAALSWDFTTAATLVRMSVNENGIQGDFAGGSSAPGMSGDGRRVVFQTGAGNLVVNDTNSAVDVVVKDGQSGVLTRVNTDASGAQSTLSASSASVTPDARYVAFASLDETLVANDTNGVVDIFIKDLQDDSIERLSTDANGSQAVAGASANPDISADGRYVVFESTASNLVANDTNGLADVFVKDRQDDAIVRVSTDSGANQALAGPSGNPVISADGRYVAFQSAAGNLVSNDTNGVQDVFRKDLQTGETIRISLGPGDAQANLSSSQPAISAAGRYVAFRSLAGNLVASDTNGLQDVFVRDTQAPATTERISTTSGDGQASGGASSNPVVSGDGRYVAFESSATNLLGAGMDTNGVQDIFLKARQSGEISRLSVSAGGQQANNASASPDLSRDGRYIGFDSVATNLVSGDTNGQRDVFRAYNDLFQP